MIFKNNHINIQTKYLLIKSLMNLEKLSHLMMISNSDINFY